MVNFGLVVAEVVSLVWGTPANFNDFRIFAALLHGTPVWENNANAFHFQMPPTAMTGTCDENKLWPRQ